MSGYGWLDRYIHRYRDFLTRYQVCLGMDELIIRHTDTEIDSQGTRDVWGWMG